jgi:hypothetical protein
VSTQMLAKPCAAVRRDDLVPVCPHCLKVMGIGAQWYPFPG